MKDLPENPLPDSKAPSAQAALSSSRLSSNTDVPWDELGDTFWRSYAERNFRNPLESDLEGLFGVIQTMRDKKGGLFLDVGTGAAPQYAFAAVLAGMDNIVVSDSSKGAIDWLKKELLQGDKLSETSQMWVDIAKLLSTFKDKEELYDYFSDTGFDRRLHVWQDLTDKEKKQWFKKRQDAMYYNGVSNHFLGENYDIKPRIKEMAAKGKFSVKQFSIYDPPADLNGKVDVVAAMYVAEGTTAVPSENCQALLNICKLAVPGKGVVNFGQNINADWKHYEGTTITLPALSRPYSYMSATSQLLFGDNYQNYYKDTLQKGRGAAGAMADIWQIRSNLPIDRSREHLMHTSGIPKTKLPENGEAMLADLQIHLLEAAKYLLLQSPMRRNIAADNHAKHLEDIEQAMGIQPPEARALTYLSENMKRQFMAERLDNVMTHLKDPDNVRDVNTMNRQDELFSEFAYGLHRDIVGRRNTGINARDDAGVGGRIG